MRPHGTDGYKQGVVTTLTVLSTLCAAGSAWTQDAFPSLHLAFTNAVLPETAGVLEAWGRVYTGSPVSSNVSISLHTDDTSELLPLETVQIASGAVAVTFNIAVTNDTEIDGRQIVEVVASAAGYRDATGRVEVVHVGGRDAVFLDILTAPTIERLTLTTFADLGGPIRQNFSACVWHPLTGHFLALLNFAGVFGGDSVIIVYNANGVYQRTIHLLGFDDAEGICVVDPATGTFAIVQEGVSDDLTILTIDPLTNELHQADGEIWPMTLPFGKVANKGIEGVTYDAANECFYVVQEQSPMGVYRVARTNAQVTTDILFDAEQVFGGLVTDLSDLAYDEYSGHLFVVSDEGHALFECTLNGDVLGALALPALQPEGITMSASRQTLYLVGEPNQVMVYEREAPTFTAPEGTNLVITLSLSRPVTNTVEVDFVLSSTTAVTGVDYEPATGRVSFLQESTRETFAIDILDDGVSPEADEWVMLALTNHVTAVPGPDGVSAALRLVGTVIPITVLTPYGSATPATGVTWLTYGTLMTCAITDSPVLLGTHTQLVVQAWTGTGSVPPTGTGATTTVFAITNDSAITWHWRTNLWLGATADGGGFVLGGNRWLAVGTNTDLLAVTNTYFTFAGWTGDLPDGADTNAPVLPVILDVPRELRAEFPAMLASNETPLWWLAMHYGPSNDFDALATTDTDGDSQPAWAEYVADTIPTNALSRLRVLDLMPTGVGTFVWWTGSTNRTYDIYGAPAVDPLLLDPLPVLATNVPGSAPEGWIIDTNAGSPGAPMFYRVGAHRP